MKLDGLRGTGVAIITPFKKDGSIDFDALSKCIHYMMDGGVDYIVTLGTTGETPVLSLSEKQQIVAHTCETVGGRVPVVVGIGGNYTNAVIEELNNIPLHKATAVLSAGPYYSKPSQEGIFQHYKAIAAHSPRPVLLYNVPARTGRNVDATTILRLSREKNIAGIKEAGGDFAQCMKVLRDKPEGFLVVSGDDALALPQIACGMEGVISVAANAFPKEFSRIVKDCLAGNFAAAAIKNNALIDAYDLMFSENNPAGVKAFMAQMGLIENEFRLPVVPVSEALADKIAAFLTAFWGAQIRRLK